MKASVIDLHPNWLLIAVFSLVFTKADAQSKDTTFIQYHPFMNELPKDYLYYETGYLESKKVIEDTSVIWAQKQFSYWRFLISNAALLAPDSVIKQIWKLGYQNSPHSLCGFYTYIFEKSFNSQYLNQSPVAYFYLHHEKTYFDSICNALHDQYDSTLIKQLWQIVTDDKGRGRRELTKAQASKDSINQIKIASMIKSLGKYPGRSIIGHSLEEVAWLVIQHAPISYQTKYLPYLEAAVKEKDLDPKYLAYTIDRINMGNNVPQIYGTQFTTVDNVNKLYPVKDLQSIDQLRKSVGLGPLKEYLDQNKIVIN